MTQTAPDFTWDRHAIKAELGRRGLTLVAVARDAGLEPSACKVALRRRNWGGEAAIAAALDVPPEELWPERYGALPRRNVRTKRRRASSRNCRAA